MTRSAWSTLIHFALTEHPDSAFSVYLVQEIERVLRLLPKKAHRVFSLRVSGMQYKQIAAALGYNSISTPRWMVAKVLRVTQRRASAHYGMATLYDVGLAVAMQPALCAFEQLSSSAETLPVSKPGRFLPFDVRRIRPDE